MNISKIFSTKERLKIIRSIIYNNDLVSVSEVARELKLSKAFVSKYFDILMKERTIERIKNKFLIIDNLYTRGIKILLNVDNFDPNMFKKYKFVKGAGLYGSSTKGTNTLSSDVDLWIKIKNVSDLEIAKLNSELNKKYKDIKPLFLTEQKIEQLKKEDQIFYCSLIFGSIILFGEDIEV